MGVVGSSHPHSVSCTSENLYKSKPINLSLICADHNLLYVNLRVVRQKENHAMKQRRYEQFTQSKHSITEGMIRHLFQIAILEKKLMLPAYICHMQPKKISYLCHRASFFFLEVQKYHLPWL